MKDLALLEARDLPFARLLQYRAFKEVAAIFDTRITEHAGRLPRTVGLDPQFAELLPKWLSRSGRTDLRHFAASALMPQVVPTVGMITFTRLQSALPNKPRLLPRSWPERLSNVPIPHCR